MLSDKGHKGQASNMCPEKNKCVSVFYAFGDDEGLRLTYSLKLVALTACLRGISPFFKLYALRPKISMI